MTTHILLFLSVYGSESSTGAKVKQHESCLWSEGSKLPRVRKFHGMKVLGTFAPEERKFHRSESSMERKFLGFSLPGSECSTERKFHGSESSFYGLFAPGNESAEERKGKLPCKSAELSWLAGLIVIDGHVIVFDEQVNALVWFWLWFSLASCERD